VSGVLISDWLVSFILVCRPGLLMYRALLELLISAIGPCSIYDLIGVGDFATKKKQIAQSSNEAEIFLLVLIRIVISPILNKSLVSFHKPYYFQK